MLSPKTIFGCLIFLLLIGGKIWAQPLRYQHTPDRLAIYMEGKTEPAISFDLKSDWISFKSSDLKPKGKMGSYVLKERLHHTYASPSIDSISIARQNGRFLGIAGKCKEKDRELKFLLSVVYLGPNHIQLKASAWNSDWATERLQLKCLQSPDAHIFGLGEQFSHVDMQGKQVPMMVEENGIGRGDQPISRYTRLAGVAGNEFSTYCPMPFFMSTEGRAFCASGGTPLHFDFSQQGSISIAFAESEAIIDIWQQSQPLDMLQSFSEINGRFRMLPDWAWGTWLGIQGGKEYVNTKLNEVIAAGCPVSVLWIQDWAGIKTTPYGQRLKWHWHPDFERYPELPRYISQLNANGIKVLGYINPFWLAEGDPPKGLILDENRRPIKLSAGGFDAWQFEVASSDGALSVQQLLSQMLDLGFSGWMADFGEWYPPSKDLQRYEQVPLPWLNQHNQFPVHWQAQVRKALQKRKDSSDLIFFSRSGYLGVGHEASIFWAGDQMTSFGEQDGLPSALRALLSSGMSGISINHTDIGGYTNVNKGPVHINRDAYLLQRWAEFAAFSPIFRTHEGLMPANNVQPWDQTEVLAHFVRMAKVHAALKPYLIQLNKEASEKGWPMIRHLWLHYPDDPQTFALDRQFLLGKDILVAPNMQAQDQAGAERVRIYFPNGKWRHLFDQEIFVDGPIWKEIEAPIGKPAAFISVGSEWEEILLKAIDKI